MTLDEAIQMKQKDEDETKYQIWLNEERMD